MKLSIEQVQALAESQKYIKELQTETGVYSINDSYVHLPVDTFVATFPTYVAEKRIYCNSYTHDLSTVAGGVNFIAVTSNEEYIRGHEIESSTD